MPKTSLRPELVDENLKTDKETAFVLMPDVVFRLKRSDDEHASLCLTVPLDYSHVAAIRDHIFRALSTRKICKDWVDEGKEYMSVTEGDLVEVQRRDSSGWSYARKLRSSLEERAAFVREHQERRVERPMGWFPDACSKALLMEKSWAEICTEEFDSLRQEYRCLVSSWQGGCRKFSFDPQPSEAAVESFNCCVQLTGHSLALLEVIFLALVKGHCFMFFLGFFGKSEIPLCFLDVASLSKALTSDSFAKGTCQCI